MKIAKNPVRISRSRVVARIVGAVIVVGIAAGGTWFTLHAQSKNYAAKTVVAGPIYKTSVKKEQPKVVSIPARLKIPSINVDAPIESMGVTAQGDMDSPDGPDNAGWYKLGPRPGEIGSAVIDGHFGWKGNTPAVFDDLHTLQKGDLVIVEDDAKTTYTFAITELRTFGPNDNATEVFKSSDDVSHLNLITCQGVWNKDLKSYSTRLVVFADLQR